MKTRLSFFSLVTAVVLISFINVQAAEAKLKVRVNDRSSRAYVGRNLVPVPHHRVEVRRVPLPVRRHVHYDITKSDRKTAKRLAKYAEISRRELLNLRKQGYRWSEIGRWLEISPRAVYAAQDNEIWRKFLRHEARYARGHRDRYWDYDDRSVCYHR